MQQQEQRTKTVSGTPRNAHTLKSQVPAPCQQVSQWHVLKKGSSSKASLDSQTPWLPHWDRLPSSQLPLAMTKQDAVERPWIKRHAMVSAFGQGN